MPRRSQSSNSICSSPTTACSAPSHSIVARISGSAAEYDARTASARASSPPPYTRDQNINAEP